jgi:hypothetical protein
MLSCLISRLTASWNAWLRILGFLAGVLGVIWAVALAIFLAGLASGATAVAAAAIFIEAIAPSVVIAAGAIALLLAFVLADIIVCFVFSRLPQPNPPPPNQSSPLQGDMDCEAARREAETARQRVDALTRAVMDRANAVRQALDRLNTSRMALGAASAALIAAVVLPWLLPAAIAAVAGAGLAVGLAARELAREEEALMRGSAALARAQADLARAEAQAEISCRTPAPPPALYPLAIPMTAMTVIVGISPPLQPPQPTVPPGIVT